MQTTLRVAGMRVTETAWSPQNPEGGWEMASQQANAARAHGEQLVQPPHFIGRRLRSDSLAHSHVEKEKVRRLANQWQAVSSKP